MTTSASDSPHDALRRARARADQAERFGLMLQSVVAASRALLDEPDFQRGVERWLGLVAEAVGADRAVLGQFAAEDPSRPPAVTQIVLTRPGGACAARVPIAASVDYERWTERLARGETVWVQRDELVDPALREFWAETGCCTNLMVPVVVQRRTVAWVCFDWRERREEDAACAALVRTAADAAAAAIKRHEAMQAALAEREARTAELAAVNEELERRTRLLAASAQASALLAACEHFDEAVVDALGVVARAAEFDRARIVEYVDPAGNPDPRVFRVTYEWRSGADERAGPTEPLEGTLADMPDFAAQILRRDSIVDYRREELPDRATSAWWRATEVRYHLAGSIWLDQRPWGAFLCDDHATERRRTAEEKGVIGAAGRAIGQAIHRRRLELKNEHLQRQVLTEREQAARDRAIELTAANEALTRALATIAVEPALTRVPEALLTEIARAAEAEVVYWFDYEATANRLTPRLRVQAGKLLAGPVEDEPGVLLGPFDADITPAFRALCETDQIMMVDMMAEPHPWAWPGLIEWHRRNGRRGAMAFVIKVGNQPLGVLGMGFNHRRSLTAVQEQLLRSLSNQFALATQVIRLAEQARQAAVLGERNRIARDLHDTLAQGFTGVLAQLGAVEGALEAGRLAEINGYLDRAKSLARWSLAEARSSVHALRPETHPGPLAARLRRMLAAMTHGTGLEAVLEESGPAGELGPAADWCVHKFVQEALANTVKHAGARTFRVELAWAEGFFARVEDDGRGFDPRTATPGLGLRAMRERALEAGGRLTIESRPGQGTRLGLSFPRPPDAIFSHDQNS